MKRIILATAAAVALSGCATITRGPSQAFTVESDPGGAQVKLSTGQACDATPCTFAKIKRDSEFSVTVSKAGYQPSTHAITHQTSSGGGAGMAGNILLGGIIGAAIDANNGATQELKPNPLKVVLDKEAPPEPAPAIAAAPQGPTPEAAVAPAEAIVAAAPQRAALEAPVVPVAAPAGPAPVAQ